MYRIIRLILKHDTKFWRASIYGILFLTTIGLIGISSGMPTGIGFWFDLIAITLVGLIAIGIGSFIVAGILTILRIPLPRLFMGIVICVYFALSQPLSQFNLSYWGAAFITVTILVIGFLLGSSVYLFRNTRQQRWRWVTTVYFGGVCALFLCCVAWLISPGPEVFPVMLSYDPSKIETVERLNAEDPSQEGPYEVIAFTYGSGNDLHRKEFGRDVVMRTPTVDASAFLSRWPAARKWFWGFDVDQLPLNGRVWMPEGEGPYPLVMILHGSHKMERFSDSGYDYLGELLASKGFIAVSVDENFINFSVWTKGINWDMATRTWILLQHLKMIEQANANEDTPFYQKVDLERIALIGHSRGGQAASLATQYDQFFHEHKHPELSLEWDLPIKAVVAISPTDKLVDNRLIYQRNVNYLVIQGSQDSDVNTFYGDRQFRRTKLSDDEYQFKASLYIDGANHGNFNTVWGRYDTTMPTALVLNQKQLISGEVQRQITKTYITAFLEATLNGKREYVPMFRDYRVAIAMGWIPEGGYINRFEDSHFLLISNYEEDRIKETTSIPHATWEGNELAKWEETDILTRTGYSTRNYAVNLAWDGSATARYTLALPEDFAESMELDEDDFFVFSLADANIEFEDSEHGHERQISLEIVTHDDIVVQTPLEHFRIIPPVIHSRFTKSPLFEKWVKNGYLGDSAEPVFQTFEIPVEDMLAVDASVDLEPKDIQKVSFVFHQGTSGNIYIDDVGFARSEDG